MKYELTDFQTIHLEEGATSKVANKHQINYVNYKLLENLFRYADTVLRSS